MFYYKRFREIRRDKLISQEEIASRMGIKQTQYSRYERGAQEMPLHLAIIFASYMDCSLDYLTELNDEKHVFEFNKISESDVLEQEALKKDWEKRIYGMPFDELPAETQKVIKERDEEDAERYILETNKELDLEELNTLKQEEIDEIIEEETREERELQEIIEDLSAEENHSPTVPNTD